MTQLETAAHVNVEVQAVHKRLGHSSVLRGASFRVDAGGVVAIVGANGCGKSTLLRLLSGQLQPDAGNIRICGKGLGRVGVDARSHLAYAPDTSEAFLDLTGIEYLQLCYGLRGVTPSGSETEHESRWDIDAFAYQRMRTLSFGQRKRIALTASLGGDPDVLILDEPTNGIDSDACEYLTQVVHTRSKRGKVTIAATHDTRALEAWQPQVLRLVDGVVVRPNE